MDETVAPPRIQLSENDLITAFRVQYLTFTRAIEDVTTNDTDSFRLIRLGDDLDEFESIVDEVSLIQLLRTLNV